MSPPESDTARICVLVEETATRRTIERAVSADGNLRLVEPELEADFDVLVLDAKSLRNHKERIEARKAAARALLPVLLVVPEDAPEPPDTRQLVEELLHTPLDTSTVRWRIGTALRLRRQSTERAGQDAVFENVRDAIAIIDSDGRIKRVNQAFTELFGYGSTIQGQHVTTLFESEADLDAVVGILESDPDTAKLRRTVEFEASDGRVFPGETTITRVRDDTRATEEYIAVVRDVTERATWKRKHRQYKYAVEGATDMLAAANTEGNLLFANEQYREFHGLDREDIRETPIAEVLTAEECEQLRPRFERVLDGERIQYEEDRVRADGATRRIESSLSPMRNEADEIIGVIAAIRDVTERQQRLEEIRRLSEYRRVVSAVNHWLVSADLDTDVFPEITEIVASSDLFGCTFLALVEDGSVDFVCQEGSGQDGEALADFHTDAYLDRVFEAGTLRMEDVTEPPNDQHLDDRPSHGGVAIAIRHDDRKYGVLTVHFPPDQSPGEAEIELLEELTDDIGLALHDRELAQRLGTFEEIVQRIDDPIMLQDLAGNFEVVNEALADYADMAPGALLGQDEFAFMDGQTASEITRHKAEVVHTEEPQTYEVEPQFPTRGDRSFHTTRYPHYDEDGSVDGTVAICRDVTEIRERERHLRVFDRVLRHNLHNEMNVVLGHAETLAQSDDSEVAAAADSIMAAGTKLVRLADKERRIVELLERREPCRDLDICETLRTAIGDIEAAHPAAEISLDCPAKIEVEATPCLSDAFQEVLENAVIHTERRQPEVTVRVRQEGKRVTVAVADNGPGIPEMERRVLEGENITPLIHGSGLGLWLVNHVVAESNGSLSFHENEPRGSVVEISVPAVE